MRDIIEVESSKRTEFIDITEEINSVANRSGIKDGIISVFSRHTTTGITVNENEAGLISDMEGVLEKLIPPLNYEHDRIDNNADSHLRSMILGHEVVLPLIDGKIGLGTWQRVFLTELDGPRRRNVIVSIIGD